MPPIIPSTGRVYLGNVGSEIQFTADPDSLEIDLPKRMSIHQGLGGVVTIQDFGRFIRDAKVRLQGSIMDDDVVRSLLNLYNTKGATYHYLDWIVNDFTVFFESFELAPITNLQLRDLSGGIGYGSRYQMTLHVLAASKLWNQVYTGP